MALRYRVQIGRAYTYADNGIELDLCIKQGVERGVAACEFGITVEPRLDAWGYNEVVDHIDGNPRTNELSNLRIERLKP